MAETVIAIQDLCLVRREKKILDGISFSMTANQHVAIIGPNGAGKTFFLRVLSADLVPSSGVVTVLGKTFGKANLWELRRMIGYVSSRLAFSYEGNATVFDVVASGFWGTFGLAGELTAEQRKAIFAQLAFFGISEFGERIFETLSDGERRKVLLARALVIKPKFLIFDEPAQGLDIPARELLLADIELLAKNLPIVYVTHHLEEIPACITDVVYLKSGKIYDQGRKEAMLKSDLLSAVFDYPLEVIQKNGRYYVQHA